MSDIRNLGEKGICAVPYPDGIRPVLEAVMGLWKEFCTLPKEEKKRFAYDPREGMGVGYELKETPGTTLDLKEDLHFTAQNREWLWEQAAKFDNPDVHNLITHLDELLERIRPAVLEFAQSAEETFGMLGFKQDIADGEWFLRLLHYFPGAKVGEEIAKTHLDKDGLTPHLYESHPGFQYLDRDMVWQDVAFTPETMVILPGMRGEYRSQGALKATWHRVVATPETAHSGRFSAVLFVHPARTPQYDKGAHGRLQDAKPGFNYEMPFEEFKRFFK